MRQFILLLLSSYFFFFLEAKESIEGYLGEPAGFLTFSENFPIEMDALNEEMIKEKEEGIFFRNMQIEQNKSLPWKKLLLGLIALIAFLALRYFPRQTQEKIVENKKTVQEEALFQLKKLKLKNLSPEEYYSELSLILRAFIERRYGIHALKETTEEFLKRIEEDEKFAFLKKKDLKIFLSLSDLVKFSGTSATVQQQKQAYETVLELIEKGD